MARGTVLVGNEGFSLTEADRHIDDVDLLMRRVFDDEAGPVEHAADVLRAQGQLAIADVGCGTGNTLSSWRSTVAEETSCDPGLITGVGITKSDYKPYRDAAAVQEWRSPHLRYIVRAIERGISYIPDNTFDSVLSYATVFYWNNPDRGLEEIRRMTKPGGRFIFNTVPPHAGLKKSAIDRRSATILKMDEWLTDGHDVRLEKREIREGGESVKQLFYRVIFS